jgi:hypothetical protein
MVACPKKTTAGWVGTPTVYCDGFHVRFGSMARSVVTSKTPWPAGSSQRSTSAYQSLSRALRKRAGLNSFSRMSRLAPAAISSLSSTLPMLLLPSEQASRLRYVPTAVYTRIRAHACGIAALTAAGSSFRRSVGLPGRDARAPRPQADSAD